MEEILRLLAFSVSMFIGCLLAGSVPLAVTLSERKLQFVTVLGAGLLVGTALAVIIPEGVHSIYEVETESRNVHDSHLPSAHLSDEEPIEKILKTVESPAKPVEPSTTVRRNSSTNIAQEHSVQKRAVPNRSKRDVPEASHAHSHRHVGGGHEHNSGQFSISTDSVIGLALVTGFLFMLIVDQLSQKLRAERRQNITATLGLVVHAAADGIALGAASSTDHTDVQFIVFVAIMLHKAPASFGLVTFLLHEGLEKVRIRKHLMIFSLAAPLMALLTYFCINQSGNETLSSVRATGVLMLFSAGTFLYVATVHVLPEVLSHSAQYSSVTSQIPVGIATVEHHHSGFTIRDLCALIVGAILPSILTLGHHH